MKRRAITDDSCFTSVLMIGFCSACMFGIAGWRDGAPHLVGLVTGAGLMFLNARKQA